MPLKAFFDFFHGWKMAFTHTFFEFFTGGRKFSRTLFRIFSRVCFFFYSKNSVLQDVILNQFSTKQPQCPSGQGAQNENKTLSQNFQMAPDQNFGCHFFFVRSPLTPNPTKSPTRPRQSPRSTSSASLPFIDVR